MREPILDALLEILDVMVEASPRAGWSPRAGVTSTGVALPVRVAEVDSLLFPFPPTQQLQVRTFTCLFKMYAVGAPYMH